MYCGNRNNVTHNRPTCSVVLYNSDWIDSIKRIKIDLIFIQSKKRYTCIWMQAFNWLNSIYGTEFNWNALFMWAEFEGTFIYLFRDEEGFSWLQGLRLLPESWSPQLLLLELPKNIPWGGGEHHLEPAHLVSVGGIQYTYKYRSHCWITNKLNDILHKIVKLQIV